jgi:dTDP-4-dehydrorhamnose 3,5-epimerase
VKVETTKLPGVLIVQPVIHPDSRGYFLETYHAKRYAEHGIPAVFVQDNHTRSIKGVLRGLHLQLKNPQGKLVRATEGSIFDVAVDVRVGSPTFGQWIGIELSSKNCKQIFVPPGFAHGFCVLSDHADVSYKCTEYYRPGDEISVAWNDSSIGIEWPIADPVLSKKDHDAFGLDYLIEGPSKI